MTTPTRKDTMTEINLPVSELNGYRAYYGQPGTSSDRTLVADVRLNGIREPFLVTTDGVHALLEDGNKRLNLAGEIGLQSIPVIVRHRDFPPRRLWRVGQDVGPVLRAHLESSSE